MVICNNDHGKLMHQNIHSCEGCMKHSPEQTIYNATK